MEKMNFNEEKIFSFAREGLMLIGYPDNVILNSTIVDESKPVFWVLYEKNNNVTLEKHYKPLRVKDFCDLILFAMSVNGYDIEGIDIRVRDNEICYSVKASIVSYGDGMKKRKRR